MMVYIPYMTVLYMVYNLQQTCEAGGTVNSPRPFFKRGAYTESDSAPA